MIETFSNSLINNSIYHLLNFEKYGSFPVAIREAAINNNFQVVLFSGDFNTVFSVETRHTVSIEDVVRMGIEQDIDKNTKNTRLDFKGLSTYWGPVTLSGVKYYLMLVDNDVNYTQDEIVKLAEIIELAMGMWNYTPERDIIAEFIRALRRGNRSLAYALMQELDLTGDMCKGVFFVPGVQKEEGLKKLAAFEKEFDIRTIKVTEGDEISGILLDSPGAKEYGEPEWKGLARQMFEAGADKTFHVSGLEGVEGMCNAFQIINETEAFIQLIFPHKHSFSKYELALASNCVNICIKGGSVKRNYLELIKPFKNPKDTKGKQLMETLETFVLDAGLSTAKTARLMDIHANTVQYRLKRIKEILGVDITGNTIVPGLMMALAVARIEKEVRSF
ncbi:MAG: helix-turn-helix domain-containing protein [Eubacteriales bacterium]|nr:helix-turn-helix domain-containing protein [Eubacteriales bacterium]